MKNLILLLILTISTFAQDVVEKVDKDGNKTKKTFTVNFDKASSSVKKIKFSADVGSIAILKSDKNFAYMISTIKVDKKNEDNLDLFEVLAKVVGGKIIIEFKADQDNNVRSINRNSRGLGAVIWGNNWNFSDKISIDHKLYLPSNFAIDCETSGGNIDGENITGDVKASTSGGNVSFTAIVGELDVETSGGSIAIDNVSGDLKASTSGGSIDVTKIKGGIDIETSGGNIEVDDVTKDVRASTSGGSITISNVTDAVDCETSGGNIKLENIKEFVKANTSGGFIKFSNLQNGLRGSTNGGNIKGSKSKGSFDLETNAGTIDLNDLEGPIKAETNAGSINAKFDLSKYKGNEKSSFVTSIGSIDIDITENSSFEVDISAEDFGGGNYFNSYNYSYNNSKSKKRKSNSDDEDEEDEEDNDDDNSNSKSKSKSKSNVTSNSTSGSQSSSSKKTKQQKNDNIESDFDLDFRDDKAYGKINGGSHKIFIDAQGGNVSLRKWRKSN